MPHGHKNQNIKHKQYCNKFKMTLKMVHIKKKKKNHMKTHPLSFPQQEVRQLRDKVTYVCKWTAKCEGAPRGPEHSQDPLLNLVCPDLESSSVVPI